MSEYYHKKRDMSRFTEAGINDIIELIQLKVYMVNKVESFTKLVKFISYKVCKVKSL